MAAAKSSSIPADRIERAILYLRDQKILLDRDLAQLYGVPTRVLNQAVRRNAARCPDDFMFQLTADEANLLRSQMVTLKKGRGQHSKYLPYAFTENGVAMFSSVLSSERAIAVNIEIMRAFTRLRQLLASHESLARRLDALEKKYDKQFAVVFDAIRQLMAPAPASRKRPIGFHANVADDTPTGKTRSRRR
jgi:hypothetical protein